MNRYIPFAFLLCLVFLQACNQSPEEGKAPVRPVKTMVVKSNDEGRRWTFSGTAEDALETDLSFRVSGKIVEFPGDQIGRKFAEGDIIARLDPADFELEVRQARANLEQVRAKFVRAEADLKRNRQLYKRNVISLGELDQIEAEYKSYDAQLKASAKQLEIARKHLFYTTLHAPFNGWIGSVETKIHQNVNAGQPVVSFNAGRQMKMYVSVPDVLITQVQEGDEVEVVFDAIPDRVMTGKVMEVSVDSGSGSAYPVKVYLDNEDKLIRSGMSGHVKFLHQGAGTTRMYVPPVAVVGRSDGTRVVWVVDPETATVASRQVAVGELSAHGLEILDGLASGDIVVTRGVHSLKEGVKVRFSKNGLEG